MNEIAATATSVPPIHKPMTAPRRVRPALGKTNSAARSCQPKKGIATSMIAAYVINPPRCSPCGSIIAPAMSSGRPKIGTITYIASGPKRPRPRQNGPPAEDGFDDGSRRELRVGADLNFLMQPIGQPNRGLKGPHA